MKRFSDWSEADEKVSQLYIVANKFEFLKLSDVNGSTSHI